MKNFRRIFTLAVAAAMLAAVTAAFFGAPTDLACRVQPAVSWTFLVVLLLTPLVGRFFCEAMCPLGILQSVVSRLLHPRNAVRRVCTRLPDSRAQRIVRWCVFAAVAALFASGFGAIGSCLTPYSIYGKALALFIPGVALLAIVLSLAAFGRGRIWCNWICPAGTLFSLLSRRCVLSNKVGPGCSKCRACFPKAADCDAKDVPGGSVTRREAIRGVAALAAIDAAVKTTDGGLAKVTFPDAPKRDAAVLPPGSAPRSLFNLKCVGCGLCVKACRGECLVQSVDLRRFGQPEMDFRRGYCLLGCKSACGAVCPTGAITWSADLDRRHVHMGKAVWRKDLCIRGTDDVSCTACVKKCPVKAIHIVEGFPVVDAGACIGCGACEHVCPSRPEPAIRVEGCPDAQRVFAPATAADAADERRSAQARGEVPRPVRIEDFMV